MNKTHQLPRRPWRSILGRLPAVLFVSVGAIGLLVTPASGHNYGRNSPSYTWHNSYDSYTVANDNVQDGHCVYAGYKQSGVWKYDGAYSCDPEIAKAHGGGSWSITASKACVTGHSISYACRNN